jgi:hypothetical protein
MEHDAFKDLRKRQALDARAAEDHSPQDTPLMHRVRERIKRQLPIAAQLLRDKLLADHQYDALVIAWSYEWRCAKKGEEFTSPEGQRLDWNDLMYELDDCLFDSMGPDEPHEMAEADAMYGPYNRAAMALARKLNPSQFADLDALSRSVWDERATTWWQKAKRTIALSEVTTGMSQRLPAGTTDRVVTPVVHIEKPMAHQLTRADGDHSEKPQDIRAWISHVTKWWRTDRIARERWTTISTAALFTLVVLGAGMWPFHTLSGYEYNPEQALVVVAIWAGAFAWLAYKAPHHQLTYQRERDENTERRQRRNLAEAMRVDASSLAGTMFVLKDTGLPARGDLGFGHPSLDQGLNSAGLFEPSLVRALAAVIKEVAQTHAAIVDYWGEVTEWENRNLAGHSAVESRDQPLRQQFIRVRASITLHHLERLKLELAKELPEQAPGDVIEIPVLNDLEPIAKVGAHLGRQATPEHADARTRN